MNTTLLAPEKKAPPWADTNPLVHDAADASKLVRLDAGAITTGTTRVISMPDQDIDLTPGNTFQPVDATLTAFAGLTIAAGKVVYGTGPDAFALADSTSYGRSIWNVADEAALKALINLEIGTDVAAQVHNHAASDINSGTLAHERGGLEADVSAFSGLVYIDAGATSAVSVSADVLTLLGSADIDAILTNVGAGTLAVQDADSVAVGDLEISGDTNAAGTVTILDTIQLLLGDGETNGVAKTCRFGALHYNNATEEPVALLVATIGSTTNVLDIGGGTSVMNAATLINLRLAQNNTTTTGTIRYQIGWDTLSVAAGVNVSLNDKITLANMTAPSGTANAGTIYASGGALYGIDGTGSPYALAAGGGLTQTAVKNAAYTAVAGEHVLCNASTASASFAITLPSGAANGSEVVVSLQVDDRATAVASRKTVTIDRNGELVAGSTETEKWRLLAEGDSAGFRKVGGDVGWEVIDGIKPLLCVMKPTATQNITHATATKVTLDAASDDAMSVADTTNSRIYTPRAGSFEVVGLVAFGSVADRVRSSCNIAVNSDSVSTLTLDQRYTSYHGDSSLVTGGAGSLVLAAGDYVAMVTRWDVNGGSGDEPTQYSSSFSSFLILKEIR